LLGPYKSIENELVGVTKQMCRRGYSSGSHQCPSHAHHQCLYAINVTKLTAKQQENSQGNFHADAANKNSIAKMNKT
jgi:hypothetical protein